MIYIIISFIAILIFFLYDFRKGVLFYAPWKLFFNLNVRFGPLTFDLFITLVILVIFLIRRKEFNLRMFPLRKAFVIYGIGYIIGCLCPDFAPNFIPRIILSVLAFSFVYYFCLSSFKDIQWAITSFAFFAIIMCVNGLLQPVYGINPLDDYLQSISNDDNSLFMDNSLLRMGQVRYRSFIPHPISYGVACVIILYLIVWSLDLLKNTYQKCFIVLAISLLLSGIVICGSRTPIFGILPLGYWFVRHGRLKNTTVAVLLIISAIFIFLFGDYIVYSMESIVNTKVAEEASGSSAEMRIRQYSIASQVLQKSPIWGMGMNFNPFAFNSDLLGSESVWLPLIMNNGIIGVLAYAILYVYIVILSLKSKGKIYLLIVTSAWLIMRTATSLIGVTDAQFFCVYFCIYRYYELHSVNRHSRLQRRAVYSQVS